MGAVIVVTPAKRKRIKAAGKRAEAWRIRQCGTVTHVPLDDFQHSPTLKPPTALPTGGDLPTRAELAR